MKTIKNVFLLVVALCFTSVSVFANNDPFRKYLDSKPPTILREISTKDTMGVIIREVTFLLKDSSEVYAVIAAPNIKGNYPGILVLHGGGGKAEKNKAIAWAKRGYVAVAPDLPGIADPKDLIYTKGRWNGLKYGAERYVAKPDITSSVLFDAVLSGMKSLYLLRSQRNVDLSKIGVVGVSWGGYMTTMVCGLAGNLVKAGFSVYGCGFYELTSQQPTLQQMPEAEREKWLKYLDAGRRASNIKAAFFIAGAANDFFYWPKAVQKTLDMISVEKNHVYAPNVTHKIPLPGGSVFENTPVAFTPTAFQPYPTPSGSGANWLAMEVPYMDFYLKGMGHPFPKVIVQKTKGNQVAKFKIESSLPITKVNVYWSANCPEPTKCLWNAITPTDKGDNKYEVKLPDNATEWFVVASDDRPVSVSSDLITKIRLTKANKRSKHEEKYNHNSCRFLCSSMYSKCYVSYSPKELNDLPTVHVFLKYPNSEFYVGYTIGNRYDTTQTVYNNHFQIYDAYEYRFDKHKMIKTGNQILYNLESEFALLIKGRADYTGGVHGDEQNVSVKYFIDGKAKEFTKSENLIPCKAFRYEEESTLHESPTKINGVITANPLHPVEAYHFKRTSFKNTGYQTFNRVTWNKSVDVSQWFFGICCMHKDNAMSFHNELDTIEYKAIGSTNFPIKDVIGAKTVFFKNDVKGLSSTVTSTLLLPKNQEQNCKLMVWDRQNDSKYYRGYYPTEKVKSGDIWEGTMTVNHYRKDNK